MHLFIDTNIFLSFYHLTNDDLEELRKLSVLIEKGQITLYLTEQVKSEYLRNREIKIADAIKRLKEQKLNLHFPQLCKDYKEYPALRKLQKDYAKQHAELLDIISNDVDSNSLKADTIIQELFNKANVIETSMELVDAARLRMEVGNPPGKNGSFGDAINWETLLQNVPSECDLFLVADDRDFFSVLDESEPKEFLAVEWKITKSSNIYCYRRLSTYFKEHFPDINLASELEKELLIKDFIISSDFATTHTLVAKLAQYDDFSSAQSNELISASLENNQIHWIIGDPDVYGFLSTIADSHKNKIEDDLFAELTEVLEKVTPVEEEFDPIPF